MLRRDLLKTLLLGAVSRLIPPPAVPTPPEPRIPTRCCVLPEARAHVLIAAPHACDWIVLESLETGLRRQGRSLMRARTVVHPGDRKALLLRLDSGWPARRLWLELPEIDRWARRSDVTVLISRRMSCEEERAWVPRLAAATRGRVIHVLDNAFDDPPHLIPRYYRVPVEILQGGTRIDAWSVTVTV